MPPLQILEFPDPRLRLKAQPVARFDDNLRDLASQMLATMYQAPGIGLAATQVNVQQRLLVLDVSEAHDSPRTLVNPEILASSGEQICEEGCLSVPEYYAKVPRAATITVRAADVAGEVETFDADGLLAVCIQHEIDHLDGKLFVDYLSPLKQQRLKRKLEKQRRLAS